MLYEYDSTDQLKVARGQESGGTARIHERFGYKYDGAGNLENKTNYNLVQSFALNNLNQITNYSRGSSLAVAGMVWGSPTNVQVNGNNAALYADRTFAHELTYVDGTNSYNVQAFDAAGRTAEDSVTVNHPSTLTFKHDQNGNLLTDGIRHFTYDDENQLTQVVLTNTTKSEFAYDAKMRRRIRKESVWAAGAWQFVQEVRYIYDGLLVVQERHFDPRLSNAQHTQNVTYTRGADLMGTLQDAGGIGGLLARTEWSFGVTESAYYHSENVGNVGMLIDTDQNIVAQYLYETFGSVIGSMGPSADKNPYRFSSKEAHLQSGLIYYLYRYYEPRLQRWITRDPIKDLSIRQAQSFSENPVASTSGDFQLIGLGQRTIANDYKFIANAPVNLIDAYGLYAIPRKPGDGEKDPVCKSHLECYQCLEVSSRRLILRFIGCVVRRPNAFPMNMVAWRECMHDPARDFARDCRAGNFANLASYLTRMQNCYNHHW